MVPDRFGRRPAVFTQVLGSLARRHDTQPTSASPVDHFADQCRLVAIGQTVDKSCRLSLSCQQRSGQRIRLDINHDQVPPVLSTQPGVFDSRGRMPCGIDNNIQPVCCDQRLAVVGDVCGTCRERPAKIGCFQLLVFPTCVQHGLSDTAWQEISYRQDVQAFRETGLR